jgi:hypothetical protein
MSTSEQRSDEVVDDVVLPDDPPSDLLGESLASVSQLAKQLDVARIVSLRSNGWCASCRRGHVG